MNKTIPLLMLTTGFASALFYRGGIDSLPLFWAVVLLIGAAGIFARDRVPSGIRLTLTGVILLVEGAAIVFAQFHSVMPGVSYQVGIVLMALPLPYSVLMLADPGTAPADRGLSPFPAIRMIALLVMAIAILEFCLLRNRVTSVFLDWNSFAAFCNMLAVPAIAQLFSRRAAGQSWRSVMSGGSAILMVTGLACLAMTSSRAGLVSFVTSTGLLLLILGRQSRIALPLAAIVGTVGVLLFAAVGQFQTDLSAISRFDGLGGDQSIADRLRILRSAFHIYADHSWLGTGIGTYKLLYPAYRSDQELSSSGDLVHNDYAQFLLEGGPVLLASLIALAALTAWRVGRMLRAPKTGVPGAAFVESAGIACALLGLFLHAMANFIFYVLPLSILAGLYLARLDLLQPPPVLAAKRLHVSKAMVTAGTTGLLLLATGTVGLQSGFIYVSTNQCKLRSCEFLAGDHKFLGRYAALLAALQPAYLPARDFLVNAYLQATADAKDRTIAVQRAALAARELSGIIHHYPDMAYPYRQLGELLLQFPAAAPAVASGVSTEPEQLFRTAVRRDPFDTRARLELANRLAEEGQPAAAFASIFDDGLRWWHARPLGDAARMEMLRSAIPLAMKLGRCKDAIQMAKGLEVFAPDDEQAHSLLAQSSDIEQRIEPGCGA